MMKHALRSGLLLLLATAAVMSQEAAVPASAEETFRLGEESFNSGDFQKAYELFGTACKQTPSNVAASFYLGRAAFEVGDYETAVMAFDRVLIMAPDYSDRTKLELAPEDRLLDIGCGWGGLARYAAAHHGCNVTAVNISRPQLDFARDYCRGLPVRLLDCDYRAIGGEFDKVVSVGMFEHVGWRNYRTFMEVVHRCLAPDGIFLLHTIGSNRSTRGIDPWIARYIFPNAGLPSVAQIGQAVDGLFAMEDWHNLGPHYDRTLMAWHGRFQRAWPRLRYRYDERFRRLWEYYLLSCAGAFRARQNQLWQILLTHVGRSQPAFCRDAGTFEVPGCRGAAPHPLHGCPGA